MIYPEINFKPKLQVINEDQITQIHFATLELLERTGVQITNRKALDVMDRVGPGGHFLYEEHTMNHFREVWYPQIFDRMIHDARLEQGAKDFEERFQEQTKKMMAHRPNPLPAEIQKELDRMAKHWK